MPRDVKANSYSHSLQVSGIGETRPPSEIPTTSSVYSESSPEMNKTSPLTQHPPRSSSLYPDDVSPPESVRMDDGDRGKSERDSPDVSPISDSSGPANKASPSFNLGKFNSNLPVPKKTRKFWNRPSLGSQEQGSSLTHWDVYSGEPTTSEKGKPPSTTPSAVKLHADPTPGKLNGYGTSTHISAGSPNFGSTIGRKRVASRDMNNAPIIRPEWKGAGGRHKIINPLFDKPLPPGKSATFPIGSEMQSEEQKEREGPTEETGREQRGQMNNLQRANEKAKRQQKQREDNRLSEDQAKQQRRRWEERRRSQDNAASPPSVQSQPPRTTSQQDHPMTTLNEIQLNQKNALSDEIVNEDLTPRASRQDLQIRNLSLTVEDTRSPLARNPSNDEMRGPRSQVSPDLPQNPSTEERVSRVQDVQAEYPGIAFKEQSDEHDSRQTESKFRSNLQHMDFHDEPPSRFSTTTYATTTPESPPDTPELGSHSPSMSTTPNSILNRKRPVPPAGLPNSRATARKPTPSEMSVTTQVTTESKRKSLPKSPPEVHAVSRVASLQAKLDNLRRRKSNIQTVIHELTHVVQPSSIAYDMASRREIKKTVEGLNKELAEIMKDEHETGLKLHRTMKRDDEFAAYEPTSIWVRRVTS